MHNCYAFLKAYKAVRQYGEPVYPRGMLCLELQDHMISFSTQHSPLSSFKARKLNLNYAKQELLWYLRHDRYDLSIEKHASMWAKIRQPDNGFNSNYGQYIFNDRLNPYKGMSMGSQFAFVVSELIKDPDSRRASIVLLRAEHLYSENSDVVCTYAMNFRIRDNKLNMTVMMRSNDAIFGTTNDVFCFWGIYQMVYALLSDHMLSLQRGIYNHFVNSLHVYEKHFEMLNKLIDDGEAGYQEIVVPFVKADEVRAIVKSNGEDVSGPFMRWLNEST